MKKFDKNPAFGLHLMLEAYNCDPKKLNNFKIIYTALSRLTKLLKMHSLTKPYVVLAEDNKKHDPGGWSGFIMIQESHISIHTFVKRHFLTADVYSCKKFNTKIAITYIKKKFKSNDIEHQIVIRGKKYPEKNLN